MPKRSHIYPGNPTFVIPSTPTSTSVAPPRPQISIPHFMLHRSPKAYQNKRTSTRTTFETENTTSTQHGIHFLLDVPAEILAAISANLDPQSLQRLSEAHEHFARHVEEDITWRGAFETHYISNEQSLQLLRRTQPTWRKEFTERFNLLQRFLYSRQPTIAHAPLPSPAISRIHLLSPGDPSFGLLSISLFHGSIARSVPSTGKILHGFIDASGNTSGSGSRTSEFTTNVSACAITSTGGTVRILWGYATGHIAFMVTNKTIEKTSRPAAEFRICQFEEMHAGCVTDAVWMTEATDTSYGGEATAITAGLDGHVKIWNFSDPSTPDLLWTSPHKPTDPRDPCIKVACNRALGMIVAVRKSGAIDVWTGFTPNVAEQPDLLRRIAVQPWRTGEAHPSAKVLALHIDPYTGAILVGFQGELCFYRVDITQEEEESYRITAFGAPEGGGILSCLHPCFTPRDKEGTNSFILAGDKLGYVSVYPWDNGTIATSSGSLQTIVRPTRSHQAISQHSGPPSQTQSSSKQRQSPAAALNFKPNNQQQQQQAAITAITWTPTILATGTSAGDVVVWDSITFERVKEVVKAAKLRIVRRRVGGHHHHNLQNANAQQQQQQAQGQQGQAAPGGIGAAQGFEVEDNSVPDDSVKQIIVSEKGDTLIVNVGGEVVMWEAGDASSVDEGTNKNKGKMRGGKSRRTAASAGGNNGRALIGGASGRWSEQLEMKQAISESHALYLTDWDAHTDKEDPQRKARKDNERAHRRELEKMGMSEEEMLAYVMMLSREQEQQQHGGDEGGSGGGGGRSGRAETSANASAKRAQDALTDEQVQAAIEGGMFTMDSGPSAVPTTFENPAQVDRSVSSSSSASYASAPSATNSVKGEQSEGPLDPEAHFPSISPPISRSSSGSPPATGAGSAGAQQGHPASLRNRRLSVGSNCTSISSSSSSSGSWKSAVSRASAWSVPLAVSSPPTATAGGSTRNPATASSSGGRTGGGWDDMDEELRFALELSLAEARSRGEDV